MNKFSAAEMCLNSFKQAVTAIMPMELEDFENLLPVLKSRTVKKGELILQENQVCRYIYFLCNGLVRMYYLDNGKEISFRFTEGGNFFVDFQSFLTQKPSRYYWEAMQDVELLLIPYVSVQHIYKLYARWNYFGRAMAEHVYLQLNERVEMLLFMKPEERYKYLLKTNPTLINQVTLAHLSSYLGVKPESLSRIRKRISEK
ncbi:Crp/Fnr family transcriptional regulator [Adhaeribacter pallidiroseus]|uniref:Cyclic nucleotide-binding domain-containing protein n=1 Tax=Adhaeribacter pallidiroseus TaxID=2072847 RepID=A0A369QDM1_9BACT|nr:Crp/Fnr family transcriptional regulator [Adhaeribacter pallidiroseus]RDC62420.1 hypothetical protein AHMF7616_01014 [Adhaeribacter pallidiroseus]